MTDLNASATQLALFTHQLYYAVPGSPEQVNANAMLIKFRDSEAAWAVLMYVLQVPADDLQKSAEVQLFCAQALHLKIKTQWEQCTQLQLGVSVMQVCLFFAALYLFLSGYYIVASLGCT